MNEKQTSLQRVSDSSSCSSDPGSRRRGAPSFRASPLRFRMSGEGQRSDYREGAAYPDRRKKQWSDADADR